LALLGQCLSQLYPCLSFRSAKGSWLSGRLFFHRRCWSEEYCQCYNSKVNRSVFWGPEVQDVRQLQSHWRVQWPRLVQYLRKGCDCNMVGAAVEPVADSPTGTSSQSEKFNGHSLRPSPPSSSSSEITNSQPTVLIAGGSLPGLLAGVALQSAGCDVHIFDKAEYVDSADGGLQVSPELQAFCAKYKIQVRERVKKRAPWLRDSSNLSVTPDSARLCRDGNRHCRWAGRCWAMMGSRYWRTARSNGIRAGTFYTGEPSPERCSCLSLSSFHGLLLPDSRL
jgi:hypothetical protein